jgi:alpha-beta hydrolase superfamily lysophospholipase
MPVAAPARALVLIVHGLGEHGLRYAPVAQRLNAWGYAVRAYDHYGHGHSSGPRGALPQTMRLVDDLAAVIDASRTAWPGLPLILLAHSMGGLVASSLVRREVRLVDALALSSPALEVGFSRVQRALIATLSRLTPNLRLGNGLEARWISHDPAVVRAYQNDLYVHDRISARLARFFADEGPAVIAAAPRWHVPTLLMWAGDDRLVAPRGSAAFAAAAPPAIVQAHCFTPLYHELFNERDAQPVFELLRAWMSPLPTATLQNRPSTDGAE